MDSKPDNQLKGIQLGVAAKYFAVLMLLSTVYLGSMTLSHLLVKDQSIFTGVKSELLSPNSVIKYSGKSGYRYPELVAIYGAKTYRLTMSECRILTMGLTRKSDSIVGAFIEAVSNPTLKECPQDAIRYFDDNTPRATEKTYARYWHGYSAITRPILAIGGYSLLRNITVGLSLLSLVLIILLVTRKFGLLAGMAFIVPAFFFDLNFFFSFVTYHLTFMLGLVFFLVIYLMGIRSAPRRRFIIAFLIMGSMTSFFDRLVNPLFAFSLPLIAYLLFSRHYSYLISDRISSALTTLTVGIAWVAGYAINWIFKIILNFSFLGEREWRLASTKALHWTSNYAYKGKKLPDRHEGLIKNFDKMIDGSMLETSFFFLLLVVCVSVLFAVRKKLAAIELNLVILSLAPWVWFLIFSNHAYIHTIFSNYVIYISFLALLLAISHCRSIHQKTIKRF